MYREAYTDVSICSGLGLTCVKQGSSAIASGIYNIQQSACMGGLGAEPAVCPCTITFYAEGAADLEVLV